MRKQFVFVCILFFMLGMASSGCRKKNPVTPGEKPSAPQDTIPVPAGWKLVWNDEFDGDAVDPYKWWFEVNGQGGGNNELQYYTSRRENAFVENGTLVIQAQKEQYTGPDGTRNYTSARIRTKYMGDWKYGRFEIRAKLPEGRGLWPAIWMMPTDEAYGAWPASGEIDIMEELGQEPNKVYGTLHFGGLVHASIGGSVVLPTSDFSGGFHVFKLEWDSTAVRWAVDDSLYFTATVDDWYTTAAPGPAPFDKRFYMILNVAVGGNWPGNPDATTEFPQRMAVDYVRVYQRSE
jgi:beta-glucanase (GH16 family)